MHTYRQSTGAWEQIGGSIRATGYAGFGEGKNNPALQHADEVGPLPVGAYWIGEPFDSPRTGKYALHLVPIHGTQLFGRSAFEIHGDSAEHPGAASHGCIVLPRPDREAIYQSRDVLLVVLP